MKKIFVLAIAMVFSVAGFAQSSFGVKAGLNFNTVGGDTKFSVEEGSSFKAYPIDFKTKTGFHVGLVYKFKMPLGFAIQPELVYSQTTTGIDVPILGNVADVKLSYLQLPVSLQWGVDLVMFRPFVQVVPYVGYNLSSKLDFSKSFAELKKDYEFDAEKIQYGIGFGAGLDIWNFQVSGRYCWDLGYVTDSWGEAKNKVKSKQGKNKGFQLSIAYIF